MAAEWEMAMGMDFGMVKGASYSTSSAAVAPVTTGTTPAYLYSSLPPATDSSLHIDDLLDFSGHDPFPSAATDAHFYAAKSTEPLSIAGSCPILGATVSDFQSQQSSFDLYIPQCEDAAELEWLSKFVEELDSFSDVPYQYCGAGAIAPSCEGQLQQLRAEQSANGRGARSKRSRDAVGAEATAAWSSVVANSPSSSSSSSSSEFPLLKTNGSGEGDDNAFKSGRGKKGGGGRVGVEGGVRRCTHCASEKTPQWRTGPLGPKTLCNACGVRYKSGRLVPEYRPAASPTFVLTQHSNSHRKVMELRRQKELLLRHTQENNPSSSSSSSDAAAAALTDLLLDDYGDC